jgi:UDP-N-acetylglucosamine 2-epimerase (non-hydrolysing)
MKTVMITIGTRPEAIKMAPVLKALDEYPENFRVTLVSTAQHRQMLDQVLDAFHLKPDIDLDIMRHDQSLTASTARALQGLGGILTEQRPDLLLVQGDTNTVLAGALAAHYNKIPVGHVEAGLRTDNPYLPFPEEMNRRLTSQLTRLHFAPTGLARDNLLKEGVPADRRLTSQLTRLHFAPTDLARDNLLKEGVPADRVFVTGNTVIDALLWTAQQHADALPEVAKAILDQDHRIILVTAHRRESLDLYLQEIALAIRDLVEHYPDVEIIYPVHLNPKVQKTVYGILADVERVHLIEPASYPSFVQLMRTAHIILTDSGGVQEEAPTFGKPVLVMREVTERTEAIEAGVARLVGVRRTNIFKIAAQLLDSPEVYAGYAKAANPFGDGQAGKRIVGHIRDFFGF